MVGAVLEDLLVKVPKPETPVEEPSEPVGMDTSESVASSTPSTSTMQPIEIKVEDTVDQTVGSNVALIFRLGLLQRRNILIPQRVKKRQLSALRNRCVAELRNRCIGAANSQSNFGTEETRTMDANEIAVMCRTSEKQDTLGFCA